MKNIHLLPADKPSRLVKIFTNKFHLCKEILPIQDEEQYQNIYITNDEKIKEEDWTLMFDSVGHLFLCDKPQQYLGIEKGHHLNKGLRKIILTTDQDLINDSVQAIDDEFLEWFVKNPSCEGVEIKEKQHFEADKSKRKNPLNGVYYSYKIIIPKEEPKYPIGGYAPGYYGCTCVTCKTEFMGDKRAVQCEPCAIKMTKTKPKQETLEEAAENLFPIIQRNTPVGSKFSWTPHKEREAFKKGAKWQQERMYSEEDMKQFAWECVANFLSNNVNEVEMALVEVIIDRNNKKFEQFKKK